METSVSGEKPNIKADVKHEIKASVVQIFHAFFRLGLTASGRPAMVAYIRELSVVEKRWLSEDFFKSGVALCQTIPGATVLQTAAYVGLRVRGFWGGMAAYRRIRDEIRHFTGNLPDGLTRQLKGGAKK